jgi:ABC-2 type transport system ATP-binding protein
MSLTLEHLRRTYGSFTAVDDLSFSVGTGEIVGLIGPNGAGKTTTLRSLAGILRPTSGSVRIDGHDIVHDPLEAKKRLAFMPDEPHLFEYLTVEEHLRLIGRLYSVDDFDRRARALLDELELGGKERSLPSELSRGMRQKVVIACGLVRDASTSRSPGSIRSVSAGCARRSCRAREQALPCSCPHICCTSSRRSARA